MPLDPATAMLISQGAKLALNSYFSYMSAIGATPEDIEANFHKEKAEFDARPHSDLLPPPE